MFNCYIGYLAVVLFIYSISYKKINKLVGKLKAGKLLKIHYVVGTLAFILATVHSVANIKEIRISFGTVSLLLMFLVLITGVFIRFSKGRKRNFLVSIHIGASGLGVMAVIFHLVEYYILA